MNKLKVPSLQHLARIWSSSPELVERELLRLAKNSPNFSYDFLNEMARDYLLYKISKDQIVEGIVRKEKRKQIRKILMDVVPFLCDYLDSINPDFVNDVAYRQYPLGKELRIPFRPPFIYGIGGQIYLPWFSFWKSNPLEGARLSLFVCLVLEMLRQDSDLENARFQILDFSANGNNGHRKLKIIDASDIYSLSNKERDEMLLIFLEGFKRATLKLGEELVDKTESDEAALDDRTLPLWIQ